jgi:1,4-dihydroxy-2-naphthoate octaprenyltransferase
MGLIKIGVLTAVWVIATTVLPVVYWQRELTFFWWKIALRTELIFALCIAFDIRDVAFDSGRNIHTIAARLGVDQSYRLIGGILLLFLITGICQIFVERSVVHLVAIAVTYLAAKAAIAYSRKNADNHVYLGLIDGVMLLYGLLLLV